MNIVPSILVSDFSEFTRQAKRLENIFDLVQIDIMDGQFVPNKSFDEVEKINGLKSNLNWELHLMVDHPLEELQKWTEVKNINRVIFHIESKDDPKETIAYIRGKCWGVGMAINPDTLIEKIAPYLNLLDMVLFMTVYPGRQGAKFLPEMGEKIKQFNEQGTKSRKKIPLIAVDGGINETNIALVKSWGVDVFGVGSAISQSPDVKTVLKNLSRAVK